MCVCVCVGGGVMMWGGMVCGVWVGGYGGVQSFVCNKGQSPQYSRRAHVKDPAAVASEKS